MIDFSRHSFHPVISLPEDYEIYDFTTDYHPERTPLKPFGMGRYNEDRKNMYNAPLFQNDDGPRTIHMGIDIGAPVNTPVYSFFDGEIFLFGYRPEAGDYGYTIITHHRLHNSSLYALFGHLSEKSMVGKWMGKPIQAGEVIAWVGDKTENGGWNPHLHFQLSLEKPFECDMPGVVSAAQRMRALQIYPDPRLVLGNLY